MSLNDIRLAKIFAHLGEIGIERDGLQIIANPFVGASKFAGSIAALIERPRRVGVLERVEHVDRLLIAVGLGEPEGIFGEFGIKQNAAVSL